MATDADYVEDQVDDTARSLRVAEQLPPDLILLKMENEQIMSVAAARPRNRAKILAELRAMIDAYPEAADEAIYSKPVGTVVRVECGGCGKDYEVPYVGNAQRCLKPEGLAPHH